MEQGRETETVDRVERSWERPVDSSFLTSVGFARVVTDTGRVVRVVTVTVNGKRYAYDAPPWVVGLLLADAATGRSVGRTYNRQLRARFERLG